MRFGSPGPYYGRRCTARVMGSDVRCLMDTKAVAWVTKAEFDAWEPEAVILKKSRKPKPGTVALYAVMILSAIFLQLLAIHHDRRMVIDQRQSLLRQELNE